MWREEKQLPNYDPSKPITRALNPDKVDTIVHTEKGSLHCICPQSGEMRDLAFQGFESDRNTLKYRCPAAAYGLECEGREQCHQAGGVNPGEYVGLALAVMMEMALGHVKAGRFEQMRSLVQRIPATG